MNPHAEPPASLQGMFRTLWVHRQLIARMSQREVIGRYRGSALGLVWSFLTPLFMLAICRIPDDHKDAYETGLAENRTSPS
jgi:lipopolysaccharide transport system permease protein